MFFLPNITGRFPVGIATFTTPVRPSKAIGSIKLRKTVERLNQPALFLEEVAFTAYYPADVNLKSKKGAPWFVRPIKESLQGFATFLGIPSLLLWPVVYFLGAFFKMPAYPNAPLLNPASCDKESSSQWPLVIFSHGLGGNRTAYSQYCSNLAASGKVVLAVEHRDGTGVVSIPRSWNGNDKAPSRTILYLRETDIESNNGDTTNDYSLPLRGQQLAFRHHEVFITYSTLCRLVQGDPSLEIDTNDGESYDYASWSSKNKEGTEVVRCHERVAMAGHSFGGCTILSLLSTKPLEGYPWIPLDKTVILDPWIDPLPSPGPFPFQHTDKKSSPDSSVVSALEEALPGNASGQTANQAHTEMLIINSETFTLWEEHYARLKKVVDRWHPEGSRIMTIIGSEHISFSDFAVLPTVFRKSTARPILDVITKLSSSFLDDKLEETLHELPTTDMQIEVIGQKKDKYGIPLRKLVGNPGNIIVE